MRSSKLLEILFMYLSLFREVSHTISKSSLIGSGRENKVGEMILSNNGVLFLDEMLEFKRETLYIFFTIDCFKSLFAR